MNCVLRLAAKTVKRQNTDDDNTKYIQLYIPIPNFYNNDCDNGEETTFYINRARLQIHLG